MGPSMLLRALSMACRRIGAQIDLIWTVNCQPELDCATAQNGADIARFVAAGP